MVRSSPMVKVPLSAALIVVVLMMSCPLDSDGLPAGQGNGDAGAGCTDTAGISSNIEEVPHALVGGAVFCDRVSRLCLCVRAGEDGSEREAVRGRVAATSREPG